jgi:hypothetical protein
MDQANCAMPSRISKDDLIAYVQAIVAAKPGTVSINSPLCQSVVTTSEGRKIAILPDKKRAAKQLARLTAGTEQMTLRKARDRSVRPARGRDESHA